MQNMRSTENVYCDRRKILILILIYTRRDKIN